MLLLNEYVDITKLSNRNIPIDIRMNIETKIEFLKSQKKHIEYELNLEEFLRLNSRCIRE